MNLGDIGPQQRDLQANNNNNNNNVIYFAPH